jgi:hypothetical protein
MSGRTTARSRSCGPQRPTGSVNIARREMFGALPRFDENKHAVALEVGVTFGEFMSWSEKRIKPAQKHIQSSANSLNQGLYDLEIRLQVAADYVYMSTRVNNLVRETLRSMGEERSHSAAYLVVGMASSILRQELTEDDASDCLELINVVFPSMHINCKELAMVLYNCIKTSCPKSQSMFLNTVKKELQKP